MKLLVIGFDGLDCRLSKALDLSYLEYGELGMLRSQYKMTVPSWTSIYTGLTLKEHRIGLDRASGWKDWLYNQVPTTHDADGPDKLPTRYERPYRSLPFVWDELEDLSVGLYGMPMTFPPFKTVDWCISGFPCVPILKHMVHPFMLQLEASDYPMGILSQLDPKFITNMKSIDHSMRATFDRVEDWRDLLLKHARKRLAVLVKLLARRPVDVLFLGFSFLDHIAHAGLSSRLELEHAYTIANWAISKAMMVCEPEKMIMVSDHGGEMVPAHEVRLTSELTTMEPTRMFAHTDTGTYFVAGDHLEGNERREWEIKEEILRLAF